MTVLVMHRKDPALWLVGTLEPVQYTAEEFALSNITDRSDNPVIQGFEGPYFYGGTWEFVAWP